VLKLRNLVYIAFALCGITAPARAQSPVIAATRSIDWSRAGVSGGIPARTTVCATLGPGVTAAQINSAIQSCPAGQVVKLNAGTYNISAIDFGGGKSNVTLRGAGADQTLLVISAPTSCNSLSADICMEGSDNNWPGGPTNSASWTAGYARGTTVITLSSTSNLAVGKTIDLDQLDDSADNGGIYVCEVGPCNDDGTSGGPSGGQRSGRGQQQLVKVTAINGNQVTISPGLYMPNWRSSQSPGAWWATSQANGLGLEDLSVDNSSSSGTYAVGFKNCNDCWVKGVTSINANRAHVHLQSSPRATVRDSYFYGTKNAATQSYGVEAFPSGDALIENNIFQKVEGPLKMNGACSGCVLSYNFSINDYYSPSLTWLNQSAGLHSVTDMILMEGNVGSGLYADLFHGTHNFNTAFRNRWNGFEPNNGTVTSGHTVPIIIYPYNRYQNIIGNVLGSTARHTVYEFSTAVSSGSLDRSIYLLGKGPVTCCQSGDPLVVSTLYRWGNYDTVTGTVRWSVAEVPSGLSQFAQPVPADNVLPASLYLAVKPDWWPAQVPWPAIGPDVTGGNIANVGGHANMIPAQLCYNAMGGPADGTGNVRTFNASSCYAVSASPSAPTGLRLSAH
jgi:hypothetical protein